MNRALLADVTPTDGVLFWLQAGVFSQLTASFVFNCALV